MRGYCGWATCSLILLVVVIAVFSAWLGWTGYIESDDQYYASAAVGWMTKFPYIATGHWGLRHTIVLPIAASLGSKIRIVTDWSDCKVARQLGKTRRTLEGTVVNPPDWCEKHCFDLHTEVYGFPTSNISLDRVVKLVYP
jgi:phosphatidylglycerophosphate synthase